MDDMEKQKIEEIKESLSKDDKGKTCGSINNAILFSVTIRFLKVTFVRIYSISVLNCRVLCLGAEPELNCRNVMIRI